ncbi:MAG: VanW family protein [Pseudonocardiaceae bacterium]
MTRGGAVPNQQAQHEPRSWFEEPIRTDDVAARDGDLPHEALPHETGVDEHRTTELPRSGLEPDARATSPVGVPADAVPEPAAEAVAETPSGAPPQPAFPPGAWDSHAARTDREAVDDAATTTEIPRIPPAPTPARLVRRGGIVAVAVFGLLALVYGIDVAASRGEVPRGVTVAGVDVGGLDRTAAEQRLREQLEPRLNRPVALRAGDVDLALDPGPAGLTLDWPATLDQAGTQPLNPWTRLVSLFTTREVGVVTSGDRAVLAAALEGLRPRIDRAPAEGTIRFEGSRPIPVDPVTGQNVDLPAATDVVLADWARGGTVQIPVTTQPVSTTPEGIRAALRDFVEPAVSAPVTVPGEGAEAVLEPEAIAAALRFAPDGQGGLTTTIDHPVVIDALGPRLAKTERQSKDAQIVLEGGRPVVRPSVEGRGIDWEKSLLPLFDVLRGPPGAQRTLPAVYVIAAPKLTTEQAGALSITTEISTFTTGGFAPDSGHNIRRVAEQVNGAIVRPGETFSLNRHTGPRNAASGYQDAGIIDHGRPGRGIGGGVSQFATTLYNASYFAGMVDVEHKEHSYYISRYPAGREATVYEGAIDVRFRNNSPTGILIQTAWTPSSVTVTFWGTKHVNVESITGPKTDFTEPDTQVISEQPCTSTNGSKGFTVTDTRVIRDAGTGAEISRQTRTVVYKPQPRVICE